MGAVYLDTSALVKIILLEPESAALRQAAARWPRLVSSEIAVLELLRVIYRQSSELHADLERSALDLLGALALHPLTRRLLVDAARMHPAGLRSLDAIHLATARGLGDVVDRFITYDRLLAEAARAVALRVEAPQ